MNAIAMSLQLMNSDINTRGQTTKDKILEDISDANLVKRFIKGDQRAFDRIVERYEKKIFAIGFRIVGNEDEALDIAQETFIKAYEHIGSFHGDSKLFTWLYRIATNCSINALRKKKLMEVFLSGKERSYSSTPSPDPEQQFDAIMVRERVYRAVETLPPKQKSVFILRQFEGLRFAEIAVIMKRSVGGVKATYFHAVRKLQKQLGDLMKE